MKAFLLIGFIFFNCVSANAQTRITIPWSSSLNLTFAANPGPLSAGYTDFTYSTDSRPASGFYSTVYSNNDAGHIFLGASSMINPAQGYKMVVCYNGLFTPKIAFSDTIRNLCGNCKFLFWAGINNIVPTNCLDPNLTFNVQTGSGVLIK